MVSPVLGPPTDGVVETEIDDCVALFHPGTGETVVLNATASDIWRLSDGELTFSELTATLARAYGVEPAAIEDEVRATLDRLRAHGLLPADAV